MTKPFMSDQSKPETGVSIIIFTYNSSRLIDRTIEAVLKMPESVYPSEIIVVDNNSTDDTRAIAENKLRSSGRAFNIVPQPIPGLFHSRVAGIGVARYSYFIFVDDDNFLQGDWVSAVCGLFEERPGIGLMGGVNKAILEGEAPEWWDSQKHAYAVGRATKETGVVNDAFAIVWGAGMCGRTALIRKLYSEAKFWLVGRKENQLLAGEDSELSYWVRMLGYQTYQSELELFHAISAKKLNDVYLLRLHKGFRLSDQYLQQYRVACTGAAWFTNFIQYGVWLKMKWLLFPLRNITAKSAEDKMDLRTKRPDFSEIMHYWTNFRRWKKMHRTIRSIKKNLKSSVTTR